MMLRRLSRSKFLLPGMSAVFALALVVGCEPNQGKSKTDTKSTAASTTANPSTPATPTPAPVTPAQPVPAKPVEATAPTTPATPAQSPQAVNPPKPEEKPANPEWAEQKPLTIEDDSGRRAMAENMIYATIRIKMEEMIDQRAGLLKSGKAPSDVEVRGLEGSIMRARDLLMEAGEIVEDVQPPIVEVRAPQGQ